MALLDRALVRLLPAVPKPVVQKLSSHYIAGSELSDACRVVKELNDDGKMATIDVLGEEITNADESRAIVAQYRLVFETIEREGLDSNVSVKPTALGLKLDYGLARENVETVVSHAAESGNFGRIDMEDSTTTDATLRIYRELRGAGLDNVGVVLQTSLRRTVDDVWNLADLKPSVRLCKGIYVEPPSIQFRDYDAVRASFVEALDALLQTGAYVGIATHDEYLLDAGRRLVVEHGLRRDQYEFQMLLGVRPRLGDGLVQQAHRLRIYVPFGQQWYAYSLRRLQENPKIAGYIASDTVGRMLGRNGSN
jgi:proline dehydrogenase